MKPWREHASQSSTNSREAAAADLLRRGADLTGWDEAAKAAVWRRVQRDAAARRTTRLTAALQFALAGALAFFAFAWVHTRAGEAPPARRAAQAVASTWTPVDLGAVGKLRVRPNALYALPAETRDGYRIALTAGELCAEIAHRDVAAQGPLVVATAQVQVFVIGTKFCVSADDGESIVSVTEGRVRVQGAGSSVFVGPGERVTSNDARLQSAPAPALHTPAQPPAGAVPARPPETIAMATPVEPAPSPLSAPPAVLAPPPTSLAEQNRLYGRAIAARDAHDGAGALAAWRDYLGHFPQGVLAPEASLGILAELAAEGHAADALTAADAYLRQYPSDGRAAEVAFIRGNLLREKLSRLPDALLAYREALRLAGRPALRDDALFAVGACEQKLGHTAEARETFAQYHREFPEGAHAAELAHWLPSK